MSAVIDTDFEVGGVDLSNIFQCINSSQTSATGLIAPNGADLNTLFEPYTYGTIRAISVKYDAYGIDLNRVFNRQIAYGYYTETSYLSTKVTMLQPSSYIRIFKFQHSGKIVIKESITIHYLIVGGGGGGSASYANYCSGAGGSGGEIVCGSTTITPGTYVVTVGAGGTGGKTTGGLALSGKDGTSSSFLSFTAEGGKGGVGIDDSNYIYNTSSYSITDRINNAVTSTGGSTNGGKSAGGGNSAINFQFVITSTPNIGAKGVSYVSSTINKIISSDNTTFFSIFGNGGSSGYATGTYSSGSSATENTGNGGDGASISSTANPGYNGGSGVIYLGYTLPTENVNITGTNPVITNLYASSKTQTSATLNFEGNFYQVDISYNGLRFQNISNHYFTINGLNYNTSYTFYVSPYDLLYHKLYTNVALSLQVVTLPYLSNMKYVSASSTDTYVVITWSGSYSYGILTNNDTGNRTYISSTTFTFQSTETLSQGEDYSYTLTVYNSAGDYVSQTVDTYTESTIPVIYNLSYEASARSMTVIWGGNYVSATLYNQTTDKLYTISGDIVLSYTDSYQLTPGQNYVYIVTITNSYGNSTSSTISTYTLPTVENATFRAQRSQPHYIDITWDIGNYSYITVQNMTIPNSPITTYTSGDDSDGEYVSLQIEILIPNTDYTYNLIAYNAIDVSSDTLVVQTFTLPEMANLGYTPTTNSLTFQWENHYNTGHLEFDGITYDITNTNSFTTPYILPPNTSYISKFYLYHTDDQSIQYNLNTIFVTVYTLPILYHIAYTSTTDDVIIEISGNYHMLVIENTKKLDETNTIFDSSIIFTDTLMAGQTYLYNLIVYNEGCYRNIYPIMVYMKPKLYSVSYVDEKSSNSSICLRWTSYATSVIITNLVTGHMETITNFTFPYTYFYTTEPLMANSNYEFSIAAYNDNSDNVIEIVTGYTFPDLTILKYNPYLSSTSSINIYWNGSYDSIELQNIVTQSSYKPSITDISFQSTESLTSSTAYKYSFVVYKYINQTLGTYLRFFYNVTAYTLPSISDFEFSYLLGDSTTTSVMLMWRNKGYYTVTISVGVSAIDTIADGLSLYYPFDLNYADYSSGTQGELSTNYSGNIGITKNDIKYGNGCLYILQGYIQLQPYIATNTSYMTVAFWFKSNKSGGDSRIFDFGTSDTYSSESIFITPNGFLSDQGNTNNLFVGCTIQDVVYYWQTSLNINDDTWRHLILTAQFTDNSIVFCLYMNGVALSYPNDTYTIDTSYNFGFSRPYCYIGGPPEGVTSMNAYYGKIDDFRVYNRLLSTDEINTLYTMSVYRTFTTASNTTHYNSASINTLTVNSSYNYTAILKNQYGSVAYSTITAYTLPSITDASYSGSLTSVTVYWTGIYNNISVNINGSTTLFDSSSGINSLTTTNLTAGQTYACVLTAYNGDVANNIYNVYSLNTYTVPVLTDISYNVTYSSSTYIFISWKPGTFEYLNIQLEDSTTITPVFNSSGTTDYASIGIDTLVPNQQYKYYITAYNAISQPSNKITLFAYTKPTITNVMFHPELSNGMDIHISWSGIYNYGTIENMTTGVIETFESGEFVFQSSEVLAANTHYVYSITVYGVYGNSVTVSVDTYTYATLSIYATPTTSYTVSLFWDGSYNYGVIRFNNLPEIPISSTMGSYTITNLLPNTLYSYSIVVYNTDNYPSTSLGLLTTAALPTVSISSTSVTSYTASITSVGTFVSGYIILNDISYSLTSGLPIVYQYLDPSTTYDFSIHVFNATNDTYILYNTITTAALPTVSLVKTTSTADMIIIYYDGVYKRGSVEMEDQDPVLIKDFNTYTAFTKLQANKTYNFTINVFNATDDSVTITGNATTYPTIAITSIYTSSYTSQFTFSGSYTLGDISLNGVKYSFSTLTSSITLSQLSPNTTYNYVVNAYAILPEQSAKISGTISTKSLPYVVIRNINKTATKVTYIWSGSFVSGEISISDVQQKTKQFDNTATNATFTDLSANSTYSYTLRVFNSTNDPYVVNGTIVTIPTVSIETSSTSATKATVNWSGSYDNGYIVLNTGKTNTFTTETSTQFTDLNPNQTYNYTIYVKNSVGDTVSTGGSFTCASYPSVSISSISPTSTSTTLYWNGVYVSGLLTFNNQTFSFTKTTVPTNTFYNLSPNTMYNYTLVVYNATNDATTISGKITTLPTFSLISISKTSYSITFTWSGIYSTGLLLFGNKSIIIDSSMTTYVFTNLVAGAQYRYYITVSNSTNTSVNYSGSITFSGSEVTANLPTITFKNPYTTSYTATVNFQGTFVNGILYFHGKSPITFTSNTTSLTITDLSANTSYSYSTIVYNATGDTTSASSTLVTQILPYANVDYVTNTSYTTTIHWIGVYTVGYLTMNNTTKSFTSNESSLTFTDLLPNTKYNYMISVVNKTGDMITYSLSTTTIALPTVEITSISTTSYTASINWKGVYKVLSIVLKGTTYSPSSGTTTYSFSNLTPNTTYSLEINVYNATGDKYTLSSSFITKALPSLTLSSYSSTAYTTTLNWSGVYTSGTVTLNGVIATISSTQTSYTFTNLIANTQYNYSFVYKNNTGDSTTTTGFIKTSLLPTLTISNTYSVTSYTSKISWSGVYSSGYINFNNVNYSITSNETSYTLSSLNPSTKYNYNIVVANSTGDTLTKPGSFTTAALPTLTVSSVEVSSYAVKLTWSGNYTMGTLMVNNSSYSFASNVTSKTMYGLNPTTQYTYNFILYNSTSDTSTVSDTFTTASLPTVTITSTSSTSTTATLNWIGVYTTGTITLNNKKFNVNVLQKSYTYTSLSPGTTYFYSFIVRNATLDTYVVSGSITTQNLPTISISSTSTTSYTAIIHWSGNYSHGNLIFNRTNYAIESSTSSYTLTNLTPNETYSYSFVIYNSTNDSVTSYGSLSTLALPSISFVSAYATSYTISLTWTGTYSYGTITLNGTKMSITSSQTTITFSNLSPITTYSYSATVYNTTNDSVTTTGSLSTIALPTIQVTSTSTTSYKTTINISGVYSSGYMILNGIYQTITKQSSTSFVFYNLTPNTTYTYNIGVYNAAKDLITTSGSVTTVELPTISVTSTSHTTSSITIQWSGSYSTGVLIINDSTKYTLTSSETTKTISNLTADTRYNYTINVYNTTGDVVSTNGTITTLPTISVVSAIADTSNVTITWSGRFTTGSIILDNTSYTFTSEKTSQSFSGLTSDTTYSYSITVNNSAYKSAYVHSTVTTMLFVSQLLYYKFNKTDISGNYIANYAQGSATYTDSILTSSSAISIYRYKYGTGSFCPYYGYINLPTFAFTSNGITISFWFYFTMSMSIGDQIQVFDFGNGSYKYNYICRVYSYGSSKRIYMDLHLNTNGLQMWNYTSTVCLTTSYTAGTWGHISIVCSGTNWTYYYNGSYAYKQTNVYYPTSLTRTNAMLGYNYTGDTSSISGYLDDFRVHNIALTSDQISTLYKASN